MRLAILLGLLLGALFCGQAQAVTYQGGTPEQRAVVESVLDSCKLDSTLVEKKLGGVEVIFRPGGYTELSARGAAWSGVVVLDAALQGATLAYIFAHEWAHEIWFAMPMDLRLEWTTRVGSGGVSWMNNPGENFAECMRVALWRGQKNPLTSLRVTPPEQCWRFLLDWQATDCRHGKQSAPASVTSGGMAQGGNP